MAPCLAFVPALMVDESVATLTPYLDAISSMSILLAMMDRPKLFRFSQLGVRVVLTGGYLSSTCRFLPSTSLCVPLSKYATKWRWREEGSPIGNQQRSRYSKHPAMNILFIVQAVPVRLAGLHRIRWIRFIHSQLSLGCIPLSWELGRFQASFLHCFGFDCNT